MGKTRAVFSSFAMIIHPITMYLCDRFRAFEKILDYVSSRETVHMGSLCDIEPEAGTMNPKEPQ